MRLFRQAERSTSPRGFTLIEVVIALAVLGGMMSVSYSVLSSIMRGKTLLDDERDGQTLADTTLVRLSRELQMASLRGGLIQTRGLDDPAIPDTLVRTQDFYGKKIERGGLQGGRIDQIAFLAIEAGQYIPGSRQNTGTVQISYRVEEDPEAEPHETGLVLVREELPYIRPISRALEKRIVFPIVKNVVSISYRYLQMQANQVETKWVSEWIPSSTTLPLVVELSLTIRSPRGVLETVRTAVPISRESQ